MKSIMMAMLIFISVNAFADKVKVTNEGLVEKTYYSGIMDKVKFKLLTMEMYAESNRHAVEVFDKTCAEETDKVSSRLDGSLNFEVDIINKTNKAGYNYEATCTIFDFDK